MLSWLNQHNFPVLLSTLEGQHPEVWRVSSLQDSQEGKPTEAPIVGALCPTGADKKAIAGAGPATEFQFKSRLGHGYMCSATSVKLEGWH